MSRPVRCWALLGRRAGDNDQVVALAEALGVAVEIKELAHNPLHWLGPRILGSSRASLTNASRRALWSEKPPDLTISTGHRSVPAVRALRRSSQGQMRSIHLGFPRVSPAHFDLVIATPQYPIADHPNLLRIPYALTSAAAAQSQLPQDPSLDRLERPRRLLIIGGPTLYWDLDERRIFEALAQMIEDAALGGGSVMVSTSPRTPPALGQRIRAVLEGSKVSSVHAQPGGEPRYQKLLEAADSLRVTADSVSMVSDAVWTGKPMALVPIRKSALGCAVLGLTDMIGTGRPAYPQDLRIFWRVLSAMGVGEQLGRPRLSDFELKTAIGERTRMIVAASNAAFASS